ncbi:MAG: phospholipase [Burkholderiales bacterium PBB5]|nr:MAG: phospholipase [Burkholderiales bacterium PBB5]
MSKRTRAGGWAKVFRRGVLAMTRLANQSGQQLLVQALQPVVARRAAPPGAGAWMPGVTIGVGRALRFRVYRPPGVRAGERLPLVVMLHGCAQDAAGFAAATRMNRVAMRERFLVLYPEQDRLINPQGCWNWFDTDHGRAAAEADLILKAVDQACLLYPVDPQRLALVGLSAGASMAALLAARHPARFQAVVMHSGVAPGTAHSGLTALTAMRGRRATPPLSAAPRAAAARWPALLVVHGDADGVVAPSNAGAAALTWAQVVDARPGAPRQLRRGKRYPMSVTDFKRQGRTVVSLVMVAGLGHAWSGGAAGQPFSDPRGPDASRLAWAFASRQFRALAPAVSTAR